LRPAVKRWEKRGVKDPDTHKEVIEKVVGLAKGMFLL
jgi:hypothetical protein